MPTLVNNLRAIRGPVTAVPVTAGSGIEIAADTQNNQIVISANLEAGSGIEIVDDNGKAKIINSDNAQALPIVAGAGVKLSVVNNQVVVSADETVLWEGQAAASDFPLTLSEPPSNFEAVEFYWTPRYQGDYGCPTVVTKLGTTGHGGVLKYSMGALYWNASNTYFGEWFIGLENNSESSNKLVSEKNSFTDMSSPRQPTDGLNCRMWKIVGINRLSN